MIGKLQYTGIYDKLKRRKKMYRDGYLMAGMVA